MAKPRGRDQIVALAEKAMALHRQGRLAEAQATYVKYLKLVPNDGETMGLLAVVRFQQGYPEPALELMGRACKLSPQSAGLRFNHGKMLVEAGRHPEAEPVLREVLAREPGFHAAVNTLGIVLLETGRPREAIAIFRQAVEMAPGETIYAVNLAAACLGDFQHKAALSALERAAALAPDDLEIRLALARHLDASLSRYSEAAVEFRRVLAKAPRHLTALAGLVMTELELCEWTDLARLRADLTAILQAADLRTSEAVPYHSSLSPASLPYPLALISNDPALCLQACRLAASAIPAAQTAKRQRPRPARDKVRVGYCSADYRSHPVAYLIAEMIELHDRARFEVVGLSIGPSEPVPMRQRMQQAFDGGFHDLAQLSARSAARTIAALDLDVLIDLQGFTQFNRMEIFSYRPAPIQVQYLGWPGTSGAAFFDYILADPVIIPEDSRHYYSENVVWLPGTYQPNDRTRIVAAETPSRATCGLPEQGIVLACFNNPFKLLPEMFEAWMRILQARPDAILWLLETAPQTRQNLEREARARGVASERLVFAPKMPQAEHFARLRHIDLMLDTQPYNAHTTASDALWQGVPLVTCTGATFAGRVATSLLTAAGLPELAVTSLAEYEALAIRLARDPGLLAEKKAKAAAARGSALFDTPAMARGVERAYLAMKQRHDRGEPPSFLDMRLEASTTS